MNEWIFELPSLNKMFCFDNLIAYFWIQSVSDSSDLWKMLFELNGLSCFVLSCCLKRSTSRRQLCLNFNNLLSNLVKTVSAMRWFGEVGSLENFLFSIILYKTVCVSNVPGVHIGTLARSLWFLQNILNSKLWLVNGVHEGVLLVSHWSDYVYSLNLYWDQVIHYWTVQFGHTTT